MIPIDELRERLERIECGQLDLHKGQAETTASLKLLIKRMDVLDGALQTQARHDENIKAAQEEMRGLWTEVGKLRERVFLNAANAAVLMSGPKALLAVATLLIIGATAYFQWMAIP